MINPLKILPLKTPLRLDPNSSNKSDLKTMVRKHGLWMGAFFICAGVTATGWGYRHFHEKAQVAQIEAAKSKGFSKDAIARALDSAGAFHSFPGELEVTLDGKKQKVVVQYAFDPKLQEAMESQFKSYRPDYGAFVAIDAVTGRVLSMVSYSARGDISDNLALRATFPSASVFKLVTAAAAISENNFSGATVIPFSGRDHTLYRSNIVGSKMNRWTRYITLKKAFAKSVNTVFGRIGAYTVGANRLGDYADRFGFNHKIVADVPIQEGRAFIQNDPWLLAESASGYTLDNTMSPFQGAMMAATIANDGQMMEPYAIDSIHTPDGAELYASQPVRGKVAVSAATAAEVRDLMRETVASGTSRKSFRGFFKGAFSGLEVGGKTGSLTGFNPVGKYDWFVGYADGGSHRIAIAALTVHGKLWRVKSSYLARKAMEAFFKGKKIINTKVARTPASKPSTAILRNATEQTSPHVTMAVARE